MIACWLGSVCRGNPGPGGWGIVMQRDGRIDERCGGERATTTNNRMELCAAIEALHAVPGEASVRLYTTSQYVQRGIATWLQGGGDAGALNADLWERLTALAATRTVECHWISKWEMGAAHRRAKALASEGLAGALAKNSTYREMTYGGQADQKRIVHR